MNRTTRRHGAVARPGLRVVHSLVTPTTLPFHMEMSPGQVAKGCVCGGWLVICPAGEAQERYRIHLAEVRATKAG